MINHAPQTSYLWHREQTRNLFHIEGVFIMNQELTLAPPEKLEPPKPVTVVDKQQAGSLIRLDNAQIQKLDNKVERFIGKVLDSGVNSEPFDKTLDAIHKLGTKAIESAAGLSNPMMERSLKSMNSDTTSGVSDALRDLRKAVEDLDPSSRNDLLSPGFLEKIPFIGEIFGSPLRNYFLEYHSAQATINAIINALRAGKEQLQRDNASIDIEKHRLWDAMQELQKAAYLGRQIDTALVSRIAEIEIDNPQKARVVKEEMLFYTRQKVQDLLIQQAVSIQGYLALDMVRKNNLELVKGVDRAINTTVSALRTAIVVAQALDNQKLVLDQINALNTTTSDLIEANARMLRQQSGDIGTYASSTTIDMDKLKNAFNDIYATMDMIADYKLQALDNMQQTVTVLSDEVEKANTYLDRVRHDTVQKVTEDLVLAETVEEEDLL